jgi:5-methylcytosine-specific restriction endonuclease McrA
MGIEYAVGIVTVISAMPSQRQKQKNTVSQAKNRMRKTIQEILDPSPRSVDPVWEYFGSRCAYCDKELSRDSRDAHIDHADPGGGNGLGNLVLSCEACNGDEKREESWHSFLRRKATDDILFAEREQRIRSWIDQHPRRALEDSPEITHARAGVEDLIEQFGVKCSELRTLVSQRDAIP